MARNITTRRQKTGAAVTGASVIGALVVGPRLMGPSAMAPLAIAASAVGALAIGRLAIADAVIRKLRAEEVEIGSLKVRELEVAGQRWPGSMPPSENDGLNWPHCDGLNWPHFVRADADDLALIERGSEAARKWVPEWSCSSRSDGTGIGMGSRSGRWRRSTGFIGGR